MRLSRDHLPSWPLIKNSQNRHHQPPHQPCPSLPPPPKKLPLSTLLNLSVWTALKSILLSPTRTAWPPTPTPTNTYTHKQTHTHTMVTPSQTHTHIRVEFSPQKSHKMKDLRWIWIKSSRFALNAMKKKFKWWFFFHRFAVKKNLIAKNCNYYKNSPLKSTLMKSL